MKLQSSLLLCFLFLRYLSLYPLSSISKLYTRLGMARWLFFHRLLLSWSGPYLFGRCLLSLLEPICFSKIWHLQLFCHHRLAISSRVSLKKMTLISQKSRCDNFYVIIQDESETIKLNITTDQIWTELLDAPIEARKNTPLNISNSSFVPRVLKTNFSWTIYFLFPHRNDPKAQVWSPLHLPDLPNKRLKYSVSNFFSLLYSMNSGPYTFILPEMSPKDSARPIKFALYADIDTVFTNYTLIALNEMVKFLHEIFMFTL